MGARKDQPYTHGEIMEKLEELREESTLNLAFAVFAIAFTLLALAITVLLQGGTANSIGGFVYMVMSAVLFYKARRLVIKKGN